MTYREVGKDKEVFCYFLLLNAWLCCHKQIQFFSCLLFMNCLHRIGFKTIKWFSNQNNLIDCIANNLTEVNNIDSACANRKSTIYSQVLVVLLDKRKGQCFERNIVHFEFYIEETFQCLVSVDILFRCGLTVINADPLSNRFIYCSEMC